MIRKEDKEAKKNTTTSFIAQQSQNTVQHELCHHSDVSVSTNVTAAN